MTCFRIVCIFFLASFVVCLMAQTGFARQKIYRAQKGKSYDFSAATQHNRKELKNKIEKEGFRSLNQLQKFQLIEYELEEREDIWDVSKTTCSFYCEAGNYTVHASSCHLAGADREYGHHNLNDFSYRTAWVEGAKGSGAGEVITFTFAAAHPRITRIIIANGYVKSRRSWEKYNRVKKMQILVNGKPHGIIFLEDIYAEQMISIEPIGHADRSTPELMQHTHKPFTISFKIMEVYPGLATNETAISEIFFDGIDVH